MMPLVQLSLVYLMGVSLGLGLPDAFRVPGLLLSLLLVLIAGVLRYRNASSRTLKLLLASSLLLIGAWRSLEASKSYEDQSNRFVGQDRATTWVRVESDPEILFERLVGGHETGRAGALYLPQVRKVRALGSILPRETGRGKGIPVRATFRLSEKFPGELLSYGDLVEVRGPAPAKPWGAMNPGGFDYAAYLRAQAIPLTLGARPGTWRVIRHGAGGGFRGFSFALKRVLEERVIALWPHPANALFLGLFVGEDTALNGELVDDFAVTGTVHILAVSGANTALVTGLLFLVLRVLGFRRKRAAGLTLLGLGIFIVMTGAPPSVCRSGLWAALVLAALLLERAPHLGTLVASSAAFLVTLNPFTLMDLSFQLSYLAALGLVVFTPWWMEKMGKLWEPVKLTLAATLGAQMGVWVLMAAKFNLFATYSLPANLVVAPLVAVGTAAGLLATVASFIWRPLGTVFAAAAQVPLDLLPALAHVMAGWPKASIVVGTPPTVWTATFHILLGATFLAFWPKPRPEKPSLSWLDREVWWEVTRGWMKRAWLVFVLVTGAALGIDHFRHKPFQVTFLSVGHGDSVVVRDPSGRVFVWDGGKKTEGSARWSPLVAYLRHEGIGRVDAICNSHPDADHVGGLVDLLATTHVGAAYQGLDDWVDLPTYQRFREGLARQGLELRELSRGESFEPLPDLGARVLHPPAWFHPKKHLENNRSLALLLNYPKDGEGVTFLFPGDLEKEGWDVLSRLEKPTPKIQVLLAPHHGRPTGEPNRAIRLLQPLWVVASDLKAHPELQASGVRVLSTAETGAVQMEVDALGHLQVTAFRGGRDLIGGDTED